MLAVMALVLIAGDVFSLIHYPRKRDLRNLSMLVPGLLLGVLLGTVALDWFLGLPDGRIWMRKLIGLLSVGFVLVQFYRMAQERRQGRPARPYRPRAWQGVALGAGAGLASTVAHAAGPLITLFLLPQRLDRQVFVGTVIRYFFIGNVVKLVPYARAGLMTRSNVELALVLVPWVVVGTLAGVWLNRRFADRAFRGVVYCLALCAGGLLLFGGGSGGRGGAADARTAEKGFGEGLSAYRSGDYEAAGTAFGEAAALPGPWRDRAALNKGIALYGSERYSEAEATLQAAEGSDEAIVRLRALFNLGNAAFRSDRFEAAVEAYECAAEGCRAEMAHAPAGADSEGMLAGLLARARSNLALARVRLRASKDAEAAERVGAPDGTADGTTEDDRASGKVEDAERTVMRGDAAGYAGSGEAGTRSVREILDGVGRRDTGPVLKPEWSQRQPGGKNW
jgi:uncharacterized membrane protein YfcA